MDERFLRAIAATGDRETRPTKALRERGGEQVTVESFHEELLCVLTLVKPTRFVGEHGCLHLDDLQSQDLARRHGDVNSTSELTAEPNNNTGASA